MLMKVVNSNLSLFDFSNIPRYCSYHELFLRGMPVLASRMRRTRVNGNGTRRAADPDTEPDFYTILPVPRAYPMQMDDSEEDAATAEMKVRLGEVSNMLQAEYKNTRTGIIGRDDLHPVTSSHATL
mmetsp:Transcript_61396/g.181498  ORF Transcript_61396/g.181498 Transcript_61396/m.181498 type:complete len:126 (-) Transcript_61396:161-538(-)